MNMATNDVTVGREALNDDSAGERINNIGGKRNDNAGNEVVCEECLRMKLTGIDGGFHLCPYDEVTIGFRSSAGPIARPARVSHKGAVKKMKEAEGEGMAEK